MSKQKLQKPVRILVVEDHETLRETMETWLREEFTDISIYTAVTGEEAVAKASRLKPEIILMDIRLPGISGIEAMREIFRRGIQTEVVIITNHNEEIYWRDAKNAGARSFVLKRMMWDTLPAVLIQLMNIQSTSK